MRLLWQTFRERLLSGFSWNLLSTAALQGSVLLSTVVVARLLPLESFGAYAVLVTTAMTTAAIAQGGAGIFATKFVGERASQPEQVARILKLCAAIALATGLIATLILLLGASTLASLVLGNPALETPARLVALAVVFQVSVAYRHGALQGLGAFRQISMAGAAAGAGHLIFISVGAWKGALEGALIGFVAASAFRALCFHLALSRVRREHHIPSGVTIDPADYRLIWSFALPASLAGYVTMPCLWLVTVFVTRLPDGLSMVALFSVAHQIRMAILQLPALLNGVAFAILSRMQGQKEGEDFRQVFWTNIVINLCFTLSVVGLLMLAAPQVLALYGSECTPGAALLMVLLASVIPEVLGMNLYQLVQTTGRMWRSLALLVVPRDLMYLFVAVAFLPRYGVMGAAIAYLLAQTVGLLLTALIGRGALRASSGALATTSERT